MASTIRNSVMRPSETRTMWAAKLCSDRSPSRAWISTITSTWSDAIDVAAAKDHTPLAHAEARPGGPRSASRWVQPASSSG